MAITAVTAEPISGTIQPGKSLVSVFTTRSKRGQEYVFAWTGEGKPLERGATDLPVGKYRLTVGMKLSTFSQPTKEPEPWVGDLTTKPVEFKVVSPEETGDLPINSLISDLDSKDGAKRVSASAEIFRRGKAVLPDLKKAGAKQVAPVGASVDGTRRLDIVYSVLEGFPPNLPQGPCRLPDHRFRAACGKKHDGRGRSENVQAVPMHPGRQIQSAVQAKLLLADR